MGQASSRPHESILIADSDEAFRTLVAGVLGQAGFVTQEASTGREALERALRERPSLVVLEVCLGGLSGYEVCRELRDEYGGDLPVVFVSGNRAKSYDRVAGFLVGGDDFLVKPFALDEFVARVRRLLERAESRAETPVISQGPLTAREVEILSLIADGLGNHGIAKRLFISPRTVGTHIERIFKKLDVHSQAHAVAFAYKQGVLPAVAEPQVPHLTHDA